jgi:membrane-associated protease RseP (regulator of RpoE activity)
MNKRFIFWAGAVGVLGFGLMAMTGTLKAAQDPPAQSQAPQDVAPPASPAPPAQPKATTRLKIRRTPNSVWALQEPDSDGNQAFAMALSDEGGSWLGVETQEVTAEKAKELKLSPERGVFVGKVLEDSPAAKAGLKDGDVITEVNGQRVEGAVQFRRMIREIPAGRAVQLTVWRDGRSQNVSATLGKVEENLKRMIGAMPQTFKFRMPEMPDVAPLPDIPSIEWNGSELLMGHPRLGIDAEDIGGQLGSYFGAPDGEGILVREVSPGSAAEKAGVKAGDVITSLNGERIHGLSELRSKLSALGEGKSAKLGILRKEAAMTLDVELPARKTKATHKTELRTKI